MSKRLLCTLPNRSPAQLTVEGGEEQYNPQ